VIDDDNVDHGFLRFKLEAELALDRDEYADI
jgi:hypothetical protein